MTDPWPSLSNAAIARVAAVCFAVGVVLGLFFITANGDLRADRAYAEIVHRANDFENYGRVAVRGWQPLIHPVYAAVVDANRTAIPAIFAGLTRLTGGEAAGRVLLTSLYEGLYGLAVPLLIFAATRKAWVAFVASICVFALARVELIYGYSYETFTGYFAGSLFIVELALLLMARRRLALVLWLIHVFVHPTTAVMWAPVVFCFLFVTTPMTPPPLAAEAWGWARKFWQPLLALSAVAIGVALWIAESLGLLASGVDAASYWALVRVRTLHTLFLSTDRAFLIIVYLQMVVALALLGFSKLGENPLGLLNRICALHGLGIAIAAALLVETETSVVVAATLPLRFATIMFALIFVNLAMIAAGGRSAGPAGRVAALLMLISCFQGFDWNPLQAIALWALGQRWLEQGISGRRAIAFAVGILSVTLIVTLVIPMNNSGLAGWYSRTLPTWAVGHAAVIAAALDRPSINSAYCVLFAIAAGYVALILAASRLLVRGARAMAAAAALCAALVLYMTGPKVVSPAQVHAFGTEAPQITGPSGAADDSAALVAWLRAHVPPGESILGDPNFQLRRMLPNRVSLDDDMLSLVPYAPQTARTVADEYRTLYGVDFEVLASERGRIWEFFNDEVWSRARDRTLEGQTPGYCWVVERTQRTRSEAVPAFENDAYRVYRCASSS